VFHDPSLAKRTRPAATAMRKGVATLWDGDLGLYRYDKLLNGSLQATTWSYYYPDATSEAWAVAVGNFLSPAHLVPSARARQLMATFTGTWPQWTQPGATVEFNSGPNVVNYWPLIGGALISVRRKAEGLAGTQAIENYALATDRAYPFVVASAGQMVQVLDSP